MAIIIPCARQRSECDRAVSINMDLDVLMDRVHGITWQNPKSESDKVS